MSATSLEAAWDHFVADCAAEGVPVEPVALIRVWCSRPCCHLYRTPGPCR